MRQAEVLPAPADEQVAARRPGRPRSERAERAILDAALELFAESGVGGVCMEAVAARAGVGKATIYRRWPGKEDLLLDALALLKSPLPEPAASRCARTSSRCSRVMCQDAADPGADAAVRAAARRGREVPEDACSGTRRRWSSRAGS